nr:hypothetical protein [Tanacetum cinerariifolium]
MSVKGLPIVNALADRLLGAYDLRVTTPRTLVQAGDRSSEEARSCTIVQLFEILAQRLGFLQTYELNNIIVDVFEYHFQVCFDKGYKAPLHKHPIMYVDHMYQPWRTLAAIINKCLFGKTTSNDRLRKSKDILWGMFYRENVDYPELIWEDFAFQIDHEME